MAINNSTNRILQLTTNGVPYAVSSKELDTLILGQGQFLGGNSSGAPSAWTIVGGANGLTVDTNTTPGQVIINAPTPPQAGTKWNVATTNTTISPKNGYIASGTTSLVFTLPANATPGDTYEVVGAGSSGATFTIQAGTGQIIYLGDTSSAAAGTAVSTLSSDAASIVYVGNNLFSIFNSTGNFNIA